MKIKKFVVSLKKITHASISVGCNESAIISKVHNSGLFK